MALSYFDTHVSEAELIKRLGGLRSYGVCTRKLASLARRLKFKVDCFSYSRLPLKRGIVKEAPSYDLLQKYCNAHLPVILVVNPTELRKKPLGNFHNIVVWRCNKNGALISDPMIGFSERMPIKTLLHAWYRAAEKASAHMVALMKKGDKSYVNR